MTKKSGMHLKRRPELVLTNKTLINSPKRWGMERFWSHLKILRGVILGGDIQCVGWNV